MMRIGSGFDVHAFGEGDHLMLGGVRIPFERGVLGMARTDDPNSAGSQVYLMLGAAPFLNGKYTAFGKVATGMGVVDQIKVGDRIKTIRIVTK